MTIHLLKRKSHQLLFQITCNIFIKKQSTLQFKLQSQWYFYCLISDNKQTKSNKNWTSTLFKGHYLTFFSWNDFLLVRVVCPFRWSCWVVVILFPFRDFDFTAMSAKHCWGLWNFRGVWNGFRDLRLHRFLCTFLCFTIYIYMYWYLHSCCGGFFSFRWMLTLTKSIACKLFLNT